MAITHPNMTHKISEPSRMCGAELWLRQLTGTLRRRGRLFAELYDDGCTSQVLLYMIALIPLNGAGSQHDRAAGTWRLAGKKGYHPWGRMTLSARPQRQEQGDKSVNACSRKKERKAMQANEGTRGNDPSVAARPAAHAVSLHTVSCRNPQQLHAICGIPDRLCGRKCYFKACNTDCEYVYCRMEIKGVSMPTKYYYNIDKKNNGPVTKEELTELAAKKIINANTPVIEVGGKAWSRWGSISGESNNTPSENASHKTPVESAASPRKVTPMKVVSSPIITTNRTSVATSGNEAVSFYEKIHSIYRKIDLALESKKTGECNDENLESFKKRFSKTGAIVGVASLACFLSLGIFNGMYKNIPLFAVLVVVGCFAQYICYHAYNAMTPLLYGSRIKVSSMGALKVLALGLTIPLISRLGDILGIMTQGGRFKVGEYIAMILPPLMGISLCAGIGYVLYNAKRFFVAVEPQSVSPGQDLVNIGRVVIRATFSVLQLFVPILMVLAAVLIAAKGNMEIKYAETLSDNITILKTSIRSMPSLDIFFISINWATFPVYSLIACYLLSLVSDLLESILSMGNRNK